MARFPLRWPAGNDGSWVGLVSAWSDSVFTSWTTWTAQYGQSTVSGAALDDLLASKHTKALVANVTNHACNRFSVPLNEREDFIQECLVVVMLMASSDEKLTKARRMMAPDRAVMAFMADRVKAIVESAEYHGISGPTSTRERRRRRLETMRKDVFQVTGVRLGDEDLVNRYNAQHADNKAAARSGMHPATVEDLRPLRAAALDGMLHDPSAFQPVSHENDDTDLIAASSPLGIAATSLAAGHPIVEVPLVMSELMTRADSSGNLFDIEAVSMATGLPVSRVRAALPLCLELIGEAARELGIAPDTR